MAHSCTVGEIVRKMVGVAGRATIATDVNRLLIFPDEGTCLSQFGNLVDGRQRERAVGRIP